MRFEKTKEIFLMITTECNWKCSHCYLPSRGSMSIELAEELIETLGQDYRITLLGGEILTDPQYLKLFTRINQTYLLTNGLALAQDMSLYDALRENGINTITLSYYFGFEKYFCGVSAEIVQDVIRNALQRGFRIELNTVIGSFNYQNVLSICEQAFTMRASTIRFHNFVPMGNGAGLRDYVLSSDMIDQFFNQLQEARRIYGNQMEVKYHSSFGACPNTPEADARNQNHLCWAGNEYIVITPDSQIYACPFLVREDLSIGKYIKGELIKTNDLMAHNRRECIAYYPNHVLMMEKVSI